MSSLLNLFIGVTLALSSLTGFAHGAKLNRIAACVGMLQDGKQIGVNIERSADHKRLFGVVYYEGVPIDAKGFALELKATERNPDTRPGMIEYKLESSLVFAAETGTFYSMIIYADRNSNEVSGEQFVHRYTKDADPSAGNILCEGNITLDNH